MPKVHPNALLVTPPPQGPKPICEGKVQVLTVWKKSLLFSCKGFTVFDTKGNLIFRVDNYLFDKKSKMLLMDAAGNPLLTIQQKKLTLADNWVVYDGETKVKPILVVKKNLSFLNSKLLAHVTPGSNGNNKTLYRIEGSYGKRCCTIYDEKRCPIAEIKRKESLESLAGGVSFGTDVFRLVVQPEMESTVAMAIVIILEQMFS